MLRRPLPLAATKGVRVGELALGWWAGLVGSLGPAAPGPPSWRDSPSAADPLPSPTDSRHRRPRPAPQPWCAAPPALLKWASRGSPWSSSGSATRGTTRHAPAAAGRDGRGGGRWAAAGACYCAALRAAATTLQPLPPPLPPSLPLPHAPDAGGGVQWDRGAQGAGLLGARRGAAERGQRGAGVQRCSRDRGGAGLWACGCGCERSKRAESQPEEAPGQGGQRALLGTTDRPPRPPSPPQLPQRRAWRWASHAGGRASPTTSTGRGTATGACAWVRGGAAVQHS